ncbi:putative ABC transport system permease protein [Clostridium sp. USBA 49]|uniref:ABC transporter permease n=1 Tax=Clostridium sp. USBA 49 TaxID=1881060 RepID=UPI0009CC4156|nr:FtsX-like permease family protein [Clostridium sp. USBA 49]SKA78432.1 putative ABC transport system permease protein [Clostridium sp. USBA 49]
MRFNDLFQLIWKNLWKRKSRTIFTMIGVIIGCIAIFTIISLGNGFEKYITQELGTVFDTSVISISPAIPPSMFGAPVSSEEKKLKTKLDDKVLKDLKNYDFVKYVVPKLNDYGILEYKKISTGVSVTGMPMKNMSKDDKLQLGRFAVDNKNECVIGYKIALTLLGYKTTDKPEESQLNKILRKSVKLKFSNEADPSSNEKIVNLMIVGISKESAMDDFVIKTPLKVLEDVQKWKSQDAPNKEDKGYDNVEIILKDINKIDEAEKILKDNGYQVNSFKEIQKSIGSLLNGVKIVLASLGGISLLVASFGITNTMNMAIYERKKEIGVMKVIGGSVNDIKKIFVGEACTIGLMGGIAALIIGFIINFIINILMNFYMKQNGGLTNVKIASANIGLIMFILLFSTFIGFISGILPASKAAKLDVISSIKDE